MKKCKLECGLTYYEATRPEIARLGGIGYCDECNEIAEKGYLVPVLNHYMCEECFEDWKKRAKKYPEDLYIEIKNCAYYERMIPLDKESE